MSAGTSINYDLLCAKCRYNLRTLDKSRVCPECGTPIAFSLRSSVHLLGAPFFRRAAGAASLAALLNLAAIFAPFTLLALTPNFGGRATFDLLLPATYIVIASLHALAAWKVTTDPDNSPNRPWPMKRLIRISSIIFAASMLIPFIIALRDRFAFWPWTFERYLMMLWSILVPSLAIYVFALGWHYASICREAGIAAMIDGNFLVSQVLATGVLCSEGAITIIYFVESSHRRLSGLEVVGPMLGCCGAVLLGVGFLGWTTVLFMNAMHFRRIARNLSA